MFFEVHEYHDHILSKYLDGALNIEYEIQSGMPNDALLAETANHIAILEKRRTQLLHEIHQVEKELSIAKARHANLVNQGLPVSVLPNEILSTIFLLCQGTMFTHAMARPFEVVVSHVSTYWRSVALGTPLLWNTINLLVTNQTRAHALQRMSVQLKRSAQCLLDISLHLSINDGIPEVLQCLTPHAQRWFRMSISADHGSPKDLHASFQSLSTPNLIHLSLRIGNWEDNTGAPRTEYPEISPTILIAPSLTFVRIAGKIVGNLSPPLSTTRIFHVDAWPKNLMSLAQFRSLLAALPCLVHLSLSGLSIHLPRNPLQSTEPISLPSLRSLRIRGNATPCYRLLSLISLPNLKSLLLQGVDTFHSGVLSSLHTLILSSCDLSSVDLESLLRSFPRVTTLSVDDSIPKIYPLLTPNAGNSSDVHVPWPELRTITLRRISPSDAVSFVNACLRRMDSGSPLQCVYLDRRSRNVVKGKELLDGLRELQPVEKVDEYEAWPADLGYEDPDDVWY